MVDHLFWNNNRILDLPHICRSFHPGPGVGRSVINGSLWESSGPLADLNILPAGTRINTTATRKHDELMFTVKPQYFEFLMSMVHPVSGHFQMTRHIDGILREIFTEMESVYLPGTTDRLDSMDCKAVKRV